MFSFMLHGHMCLTHDPKCMWLRSDLKRSDVCVFTVLEKFTLHLCLFSLLIWTQSLFGTNTFKLSTSITRLVRIHSTCWKWIISIQDHESVPSHPCACLFLTASIYCVTSTRSFSAQIWQMLRERMPSLYSLEKNLMNEWLCVFVFRENHNAWCCVASVVHL